MLKKQVINNYGRITGMMIMLRMTSLYNYGKATNNIIIIPRPRIACGRDTVVVVLVS